MPRPFSLVVVTHFRRHSHPGIGYRQLHVIATLEVRVGAESVRFQSHVARLNEQSPALRHGITSIYGQVYSGALQLAGVSTCLPQIAGEPR
jgi:hypothetical protein